MFYCNVTLVLLGSCTSIPATQRFSHEFHRKQYRIEDSEIRGIQFYISRDVLVHTESPTDRSPTGKSVVLVPKGTPGVVTEVGPNWLRVSFRSGSKGTPFLADPDAQNDIYKLYSLATEVEGRDGLQKVADVEGSILMHEGRRYKVTLGQDATLLIDSGDLQKQIDKRKLGGRTTSRERRD